MRLSSLALIPAFALAIAAPALADTSVTQAKKLCTAAAKSQTPAPTKVSFDDGSGSVRATSAEFTFAMRVKHADGTKSKVSCTVDRAEATASLVSAQ